MEMQFVNFFLLVKKIQIQQKNQNIKYKEKDKNHLKEDNDLLKENKHLIEDNDLLTENKHLKEDNDLLIENKHLKEDNVLLTENKHLKEDKDQDKDQGIGDILEIGDKYQLIERVNKSKLNKKIV